MYFIGIDISKFKHDCAVIDQYGTILVSSMSFGNDTEGFSLFREMLDSLNGEKRIGFESTGHYGHNLKLFLEDCGFSFMEINAVLIKKFVRSKSLRRTKTDSIDSVAIACYLMTVDYKPCPPSFYHLDMLKSLTRFRESLIHQRSNGSPSKIANMNSRSFSSLRKISRGQFRMDDFVRLRELAKNSVGHPHDYLLREMQIILTLHSQIDEQIQDVEKKIIGSIRAIDPPILSFPGIGPISAATILSEYGDMSRFSSPYKMLSYAGLEPSCFQSGTFNGSGHMVKHGSSHLRYVLMACAGQVIHYDPTFASFYARKRKEGKHHTVALTHVVKKMIRIIYKLQTQNVLYDPSLVR